VPAERIGRIEWLIEQIEVILHLDFVLGVEFDSRAGPRIVSASMDMNECN
jgi:hypothetical protein